MNVAAAGSRASRTYRVVQWAAGRIGQSAMRATIEHPHLELIGVHVHSADKEGRDAGELCGLDHIGVRATGRIDDVIALQPDCVLYMPQGYDIDDMCRLLAAGVNVVTTRSEFFGPRRIDPMLRPRLEEACRRGGSTLFATGSSPGFSTAVLPVALTHMSRRLDCLTIDEFADIPASTTPSMITDVMGFGRPEPDEFDRQTLDYVSTGFAQSLGAVADGFALELDGFDTIGEFALAQSPITLPGGAVIEKGTVAAQRITVAALRGGAPVLRFRANWYCSTDIDQDWDFNENGWRIVVEGDAPMKVDITFPRAPGSFKDQMSGLTAHPAVNAVPSVCDAEPGIRSNVDLPLIIPHFG